MAASKPPPPPPAQAQTDTEGNRIYTWSDGAEIVCALPRKEKSGRYPVIVRYQGDTITDIVANIDNLLEREHLTAHCQALDGAVAWLPRFVQIATDLRQHQGPKRTLESQPLSTFTPVRVDYWWKPYLPKGRPVSLEGDPGMGKSSLVYKLVAHLTSGMAFPNVYDGAAPPRDFLPQPVCILTSEDDPADTILPRVVVNGGDAALVHLLTGWSLPGGERGVVTMQHIDVLHQALDAWHPALLVFDPVQSFFGRGVDMNQAADTRPVLDAVAALCKEYACTPLYVRHIGKAARDKALYAGLGSIDIAASMRSVLFLGRDPDNEDRRIMAHSKSNNAKLGPSMAYLVTAVEQDIMTDDGPVTVEAPRLDWDGRSDLTANDLSAPPPPANEEELSALDAAQAFLLELLKAGPVLADDVTYAAKKNGVAWATIRRAKEPAGVRVRRRQIEGINARDWPWEWYLYLEDDSDRWEH